MSSPFLGEIRIFAGNFAPAGWALCNGQVLPISQNTALFSLLGTQYGGNGTSTFQLPNFQGSVPIQQGQGPGLSPYEVGEVGGQNSVTLFTSQLAAHIHPIGASSATANTAAPSSSTTLAKTTASVYGTAVNMAPMASQLIGGNQPHENRQPFLVLTFIIAMQGIFPSRN
jgi:microcystin-dependent protein